MEQVLDFLQGLPEYTPQLIYVVLTVIGLGQSLGNHGRLLPEFGSNTKVTFLSSIFLWVLQFWGGFYESIGFPQAIYVIMTLLGIGLILTGRNEMKTQSFWSDCFSTGMIVGLLMWGEFFVPMYGLFK